MVKSGQGNRPPVLIPTEQRLPHSQPVRHWSEQTVPPPMFRADHHRKKFLCDQCSQSTTLQTQTAPHRRKHQCGLCSQSMIPRFRCRISNINRPKRPLHISPGPKSVDHLIPQRTTCLTAISPAREA
jgi:hypothetical protein